MSHPGPVDRIFARLAINPNREKKRSAKTGLCRSPFHVDDFVTRADSLIPPLGHRKRISGPLFMIISGRFLSWS